MGALFGLFASLLGIGYAVHKDNQNFANMKSNFEKTYNVNGSAMDWDETAAANRYFRELLKYFEEKFYLYVNQPEYIMTHRKTKEFWDNIEPDKKEYELRRNASYLAYMDVINKYAPEYLRYYDQGYKCLIGMADSVGKPNYPKVWSIRTLTNIARGKARLEMYEKGYLPSHMGTMSFPLRCPELYFYDGGGRVSELDKYYNTEDDEAKWGLWNCWYDPMEEN